MAKIIGIDLGTSNSAAAFLEAGKPRIIPSAEGATQYGKAFPSVVAFTKDGQILVGEPARRQAVSNPEGTVAAAKRKLSRAGYEKRSKDRGDAVKYEIPKHRQSIAMADRKRTKESAP